MPLDVHAVIEMSINMAKSEIRHRAQLVKDFGAVLPVEADEARLGQVFINLLVNAAHAIVEGDVERNEIRVRTGLDPTGRVVVAVCDTGRGIAPEHVGRIFDPFFTTKPVGEGMGLGLSICHGIVADLGGCIEVESMPGHGTTFRVILPSAPPLVALPTPAAASNAPAGRRGRVLVVDDDARIAGSVRRVLGDHDVTIVANGLEALDALSAAGEPFDLVLCDLMMPVMNGPDFHAAVARSMPAMLDRIVFVTGGAFTPMTRAFLDEVPNARIEKPFDAKNLRAMARRYVP
jgi:CheY-like chemotaxis protein